MSKTIGHAGLRHFMAGEIGFELKSDKLCETMASVLLDFIHE